MPNDTLKLEKYIYKTNQVENLRAVVEAEAASPRARALIEDGAARGLASGLLQQEPRGGRNWSGTSRASISARALIEDGAARGTASRGSIHY